MSSEVVKNEGDFEEKPGYFPLEYITDFLKFLRKNKDIIDIITYNDLPWGDDYDYKNNYPQEFNNWQNELKMGIRDNNKIYVLLQHDVDSVPERTMTVLKEEERLGIRSNVMIFYRRIDRRYLKKTSKLCYKDYNLDYKYLKALEKKGFVIGYHCNAYEQALFDMEKALRIFESDVEALRKYFDIRFFSPHGGVRGPTGISNTAIEIPQTLNRSIRWVHNRQTVRFNGSYSDGGINSLTKNVDERDLRDFVRTWERGKRYRILLHPQYYDSHFSCSQRLAGVAWYDELLDFYASKRTGSIWDNVSLK